MEVNNNSTKKTTVSSTKYGSNPATGNKQVASSAMQFLQLPGGMRNMRSPSRESIASNFSIMSMSSNVGMENAQRRRRMMHLAKSRETLNGGFDGLSLNVSVDIPLMTRQPDDLPMPPQTSAGNKVLTRCFSFSDIRTTLPDQEEIHLEGPGALSDPSLSVNSDFDDEISMFFDERGEPINFRENNQADDQSCIAEPEICLAPEPLPSTTAVAGKRSKLRQRIKRKFLNFSFNELLHRRKSRKSPLSPLVHDNDRQSTTSSPSPKPEKRHANVYPDQSKTKTLTDHDIEREQGRALSKYSRNLMIFNWLHNMEESWFQNQMQ